MILSRKKILVVITSLILIVGIWTLIGTFTNETVHSETEVGVEVGMKAPDFTINNVNGEEVSLSDYQGTKVFLNFWASWCPPCREEMPSIQKLHKNYDDIKVLAVNSGESKEKVLNFLMENNFSFTTLLDKNGKVTTDYLIRGIPSTFVIDKEGIIVRKQRGAITYGKMEEMINQ
ncbi:MAG: TlpA family protein disulfide reductase [Halanaerobiales bacterium]|nr:TlpA family protein disulfide reductase [Halanaerobiales bacterium]